jgi:hypothetical protein
VTSILSKLTGMRTIRRNPRHNGWLCRASSQRTSTYSTKTTLQRLSKIERPDYGVKVQYAKHDTTAVLSAEQIKCIQRTTGKFLFYARAIDNTMLHALNDIATSTINGTKATLAATDHFLNYAASNPNGKIIYRGIDMILKIDSDAAYLVRPEARSQAGGYH